MAPYPDARTLIRLTHAAGFSNPAAVASRDSASTVGAPAGLRGASLSQVTARSLSLGGNSQVRTLRAHRERCDGGYGDLQTAGPPVCQRLAGSIKLLCTGSAAGRGGGIDPV